MDRVTRMTLTSAAELDGELDEARLETALVAAQRRHPLLGVRIALVHRGLGRGAPVFTTEGVGPIPLEVVRVEDPATLTLESEALSRRLEGEINTRLDESGPLVRVTLLRPSAKARPAASAPCAALLISVHHSIADGLSITTLLRELIATHNDGTALARLPVQAGPDHRLPGGAWQPWRVLAHQRFMQTRSSRREPPPLRLRPTRQVPHGQRRAGLRIRGLDPRETAALRGRCRSRDASVHAVLSTALASAIAQVEGGPDSPRVQLATPVDLRRTLGWDTDEIASNTFLASTSLRAPGATSFWDTARRFQHDVRDFLRRGHLLGHAPAMTRLGATMRWILGDDEHGLARFARFADRFQSNTSGVTNLGVVNLGAPSQDEGGAVSVRRFILAASFANLAPFGVAAATAHGQLTLAFGHMRPLVGRSRANALAEGMMSTLRRAIRGG